MRKLLVIETMLLIIVGYFAIHWMPIIDKPDAFTMAVAARQPVQLFTDVVKQHRPLVVLTGSEMFIDAVSYCKMGDSIKWRCWVVLPDHTFGYMRNDIIENSDGSAKLKTVWTPVGTWKE